jgi:hypothetical protein
MFSDWLVSPSPVWLGAAASSDPSVDSVNCPLGKAIVPSCASVVALKARMLPDAVAATIWLALPATLSACTGVVTAASGNAQTGPICGCLTPNQNGALAGTHVVFVPGARLLAQSH